jgi:hypothetical protein
MAGQVFLSEYHGSTVRGVMVLRAPPLAVQAPIVASGVAQSFAPFGGSTEVVRIAVDGGGPVCIRFGSNPTATIADERWAANQTECRGIAPGDTISVIASPT